MRDDLITETTDTEYAHRLLAKQDARWKRLLHVQAPYRWNLRRQHLGRTLDVGSGIGRNLLALPPGSLGVDHNPDSVAIARGRGLASMTPEEFSASGEGEPSTFDSLLLSHVVEHMDTASAEALLAQYLPSVRPGGKVFFVVPQERGFASDPTHVHPFDGPGLVALARGAGLRPGEPWSFPFPRAAGRVFVYNETCLLATKPAR